MIEWQIKDDILFLEVYLWRVLGLGARKKGFFFGSRRRPRRRNGPYKTIQLFVFN